MPLRQRAVKEQIGEASAPPIRTVKIGGGGNIFTMGGETCLFRHEKRFENATGIGVLVTTEMVEPMWPAASSASITCATSGSGC